MDRHGPIIDMIGHGWACSPFLFFSFLVKYRYGSPGVERRRYSVRRYPSS